MTAMENESQNPDLTSSHAEKQASTPLISRMAAWSKLKRGPEARVRFVESNLNKLLAYQIRGMRDREGWSQIALADRIGTNQNGVSRLENPFYGRATLSTLKRVAAAFDVALVVRFAPFGQLADWVTGVPYMDTGLPDAVNGPVSFGQEAQLPELGSQQDSSEAVLLFPQLGSMINRPPVRTTVTGLARQSA